MKYTALTIGPIYKTLQNVKSTKAIWAASYMFSYLMKEIIKKLNLNCEDVILPYYEKSDLNELYGVGLFPDRLIVKGEISKLQSVSNEVINDFAKCIFNDTKQLFEQKPTKEQVAVENAVDYLNDYLQIHILETDLKEETNIIFKINELLDTAELEQSVLKNPDKDFLNLFFENTFYNFLIKNEFEITNRRFPSTIEIANAELQDIEPNKYKHYVNTLFKGEKDEDRMDNQQNFIDKIKADVLFKETYRNYQKYIAVVQADGDNIGAFIEQLYEESDAANLVKRFSKNLLKFAKKSVSLIRKYQGTPIYAGGDDLLFMAPVAHSGINDKQKVRINKSILTLIDEIDEIFHSCFTNYDEDGFNFKSIITKSDKKPGMSYGISISYYKFPLNEALAEGVNQLFYQAKQTCEKNAVSYVVLKHSGHYFGTTFHKSNDSYTSYKDLLKQQVNDSEYIHGVVYKLKPQQSVFYGIGLVDNNESRNVMFDNFFKNNFDESIHTLKVNGGKELIPFLKHLKQLFKDVYNENKVYIGKDNFEKEAINKANLNKLYAALRFIEFLNNKEER
jgi:CRISPR-associated protein Cmr2